MAAGQRTYLDHNATSPLRPEAAEAVLRALELPGNASSVHAEGRAARSEIERARDKVAGLVGARAKNVIFTSGGTEAANLVLTPGFRRLGQQGAARLLTGAAEHPCVLNGHRFPEGAVEAIPVDSRGILDLAWLAARLEKAAGERVLVSVQLANNETGVIQPVAAAARLVHAHGGLVHTDAVQAAGRIPVSMAELGVDALTLSAHKLGGPKGVGALVLASDQFEIADRLIRGGGQEKGFRAGTENVAAIAGFGAAAEVALAGLQQEGDRLRALRDEAEAALLRIAPEAVVVGAQAERLPNTLAFAIPGLKAETALIAFDLAGVALSSGSACSSGKVKRSHVLDAMGVEPALAEGVLRVSLGWSTTKEDVIRFAEACERVVGPLYKRKVSAA
ncbi:cysteine desulfurase family protein [Microvirga arsenatis]|uniref:Cysteine desulfurase n=1 Tax=Microvirga arsenatis TaxID=2692265 RepID=A0ABW9Z139_9HYPH|nr:cysteine desulfurase family protein [Microvirga arsenatis]NBJ13535.1 aminotransferase class V-fold PLP-dependent enzyme [Microvirga arsenatis]NBJ26382.1 aminotransferase class V-fold PLP-dependent enzyme [Microvirga arsenatis]